MLEHRGARDLLRKTLAKDAAHGASGVVGPHREIKGGVQSELSKQRHEARHAFARASQGVHIDLQADARALKHRATTAPTPTAGYGRRSRRWRSMRRACRSWGSSQVPPWCS